MLRLMLWLRASSDYGMLLVLALLCAFFSVMTYTEQHPTGAAAAKLVAADIAGRAGPGKKVLIAAGDGAQETAFVDAVTPALRAAGLTIAETVRGTPRDARAARRRAFPARRSCRFHGSPSRCRPCPSRWRRA